MLYSFIKYEPIGLNITERIIGWFCAIFVLMWLPIVAIYEIIYAEGGGTIVQRFRTACSPSSSWGPFLVKHRRMVDHLGTNFDVDPRGITKRRKAANTKSSIPSAPEAPATLATGGPVYNPSFN